MYRAFFVDDEPLVLESFMSSPIFLECGYINEGYSVNSVEAVEKIIRINPDIVFTDLKMPGLNGVEMMNELKRKGYCGEFVIISAYGEFEESRRFFKMSGFDYLIKPVAEQELQNMLLKLSEKLSEKPGNKKENNSSEKTQSHELNEITIYLTGNLSEKHTLEALAEKFGLKPNYICRLFSRHLDTTFSVYIKNIRMEEASVLLKTTRKTVKEISMLCGYPDYFYFCRVFRDTYKCTPTELRETM